MLKQTPPNMNAVPGGWNVPECDIKLEEKTNWPIPIYVPVMKDIGIVKCFLKTPEVREIVSFYNQAPNIAPVSIQGMQDIKDEDDIGSFRTTSWNPNLADQLWNRLKYLRYNGPRVFGEIEVFDQFSATDWWQDRKFAGTSSRDFTFANYKAIGVSPMLRYMKYHDGGKHAAHYDAGYIYPDNKFRTLKSFVLYFTTNNSGATQIVKDGQDETPVWDRNHNDWTRDVEQEEIEFESYPVAGNMLVFNHRICHAVSQFLPERKGEERIIIRGDIIYEAQ